jgi:hypothetical protein
MLFWRARKLIKITKRFEKSKMKKSVNFLAFFCMALRTHPRKIKNNEILDSGFSEKAFLVVFFKDHRFLRAIRFKRELSFNCFGKIKCCFLQCFQ